MGRLANAVRIVLLVALVGLPILGAADAGTGLTAPLAAQPLLMHGQANPLEEIMQLSTSQPRWFGVVMALWGLVCMFAGWKIIRWSMALTCAAIAAGVVLAMTQPGWDPALGWVTAAGAAIVFGICGYFLYQVVIAFQGGLLMAVLLGAVVNLLIPHYPAVALLFALVGFVLGLAIGWRLAPYIGIIATVLSGLWWVVAGLAIAIRVGSERDLLILAGVTVAATVIPALYVQISAYIKEP